MNEREWRNSLKSGDVVSGEVLGILDNPELCDTVVAISPAGNRCYFPIKPGETEIKFNDSANGVRWSIDLRHPNIINRVMIPQQRETGRPDKYKLWNNPGTAPEGVEVIIKDSYGAVSIAVYSKHVWTVKLSIDGKSTHNANVRAVSWCHIPN